MSGAVTGLEGTPRRAEGRIVWDSSIAKAEYRKLNDEWGRTPTCRTGEVVAASADRGETEDAALIARGCDGPETGSPASRDGYDGSSVKHNVVSRNNVHVGGLSLFAYHVSKA